MLSAAKMARILGNRATIRANRTVIVAAVFRTIYGGQRAVAVPLIMKQGFTTDPQIQDQTLQYVNEFVAECPLEFDPRAVAFFALTGGALDDASIAAAVQLELHGYRYAGLLPNRWHLQLKRFR